MVDGQIQILIYMKFQYKHTVCFLTGFSFFVLFCFFIYVYVIKLYGNLSLITLANTNIFLYICFQTMAYQTVKRLKTLKLMLNTSNAFGFSRLNELRMS